MLKFLQSVAKFDEAKHPRHPGGTSEGGEFAQTEQGARADLMDVIHGPVGVDDHPVAIRAAHETAAVLREMKAKGYPMPHEVDIRTQNHLAGEATESGTLLVKVPDNLPSDVTLDQAYMTAFGGKTGALVDGPLPEGVVSHGHVGEQEAVEIRRFAGTKFRDLVVHEMGHILRHDMDYAENHTAASAFAKEMKAIKKFEDAAKTTVSNYAATNPDEFVAEVFSMLYNGEPVPAETRRIYDDLRGASVR